MEKVRVVVAAICRNEEKFMQGFLEHVKDADAICLVDTGSTDTTVQIIQDFKHPELHFFLDDAPRNLGRSRQLSASPFSPNDIVVWLDIDEKFTDPNWVQILREAKPTGPVWITMNNGNSRYRQMKGYRVDQHFWKYAAHEVLVQYPTSDGAPLPATWVDTFETVHSPDPSKPRSYLPELAYDAAMYPNDDRPAFYYCRELCYDVIYGQGKLSEAEAEYNRLLALPYVWKDYAALASIEFMRAQFVCGVVHLPVLYGAIVARPDRVESYGTAADIFSQSGDHVSALSLAIQGIGVGTKEGASLLFDSRTSNLDLCYELAYTSSQALGLIDRAAFYLAQLATMRGEDVQAALEESGLLKVLIDGKNKTPDPQG